MKITDRNGVPGARVDGTPLTIGTPPPGKNGARAEGIGSGDQVDVSDVAKTLARLAAHRQTVTEGIDTVREDRVAALREAVAKGQYQPDFDAVARSFLAENFGHLVG
jgi:flagellar biosynthesis anti-sigma factor FlgM